MKKSEDGLLTKNDFSVTLPPATLQVSPGENGKSPKRYMTAKELAEYLGLSVWTVYDLVSARKILFIPIGRAIRFDARMIDDWMRKRMVKSIDSYEEIS